MIPPALFFFFKIVLATWCIFDYMRNLSYISVLGVDGLLLSACPVYFMDIVNFIGDWNSWFKHFTGTVNYSCCYHNARYVGPLHSADRKSVV